MLPGYSRHALSYKALLPPGMPISVKFRVIKWGNSHWLNWEEGLGPAIKSLLKVPVQVVAGTGASGKTCGHVGGHIVWKNMVLWMSLSD